MSASAADFFLHGIRCEGGRERALLSGAKLFKDEGENESADVVVEGAPDDAIFGKFDRVIHKDSWGSDADAEFFNTFGGGGADVDEEIFPIYLEKEVY